MIFNFSSRIIINILFPNLETFLKSNFNTSRYAVSPLMVHEGFLDYNFLCELKLWIGKKNIEIQLYFNGLTEDSKEKIIKYIDENLYYVNVILNLIFKLDFKINIVKNINDLRVSEKRSRIDLSFSADHNDSYLSIILPFDFLKLFSGRITELSNELIEKEIINFFKNPINLFPDLKSILGSLNETEIQRLFYHLQNKNLLTPYQIALMLLSFPQHSLLIKNNLSKNIINDVNKAMKKFDINKRDLLGGIYSVEESIYMLLKGNEDFHYSTFFSEVRQRLKILQSALISKDFFSWIEEMNSTNQLYQAISITKEEDIINSISDNPNLYYDIFAKAISERKLEEIYSILKNKRISFLERIESQSIFISNIKKIKIKRLNLGDENFPTLISKIDEDEIIYLLLGVGWYVLSTALKKMNKMRAIQMIDKIPIGAKYLIIDVLQGIVNPNIIHDEIQIKKARSACVAELISLYEYGMINLL